MKGPIYLLGAGANIVFLVGPRMSPIAKWIKRITGFQNCPGIISICQRREKRPAVVIGDGLPMVVCKDSFSKGVLAFAVPEKGVNKYAVSRGSLDTDKVFGYSRHI